MPPPTPLPTSAELAILRVLWAHGPSSVRSVHDTLGSGTSYTTTLKLLQMMHAKRLVTRDDAQRQHIYSAVANAPSTLGALVNRFVANVFEGSAGALALRALGDGTATREELTQLKRLIRAMERAEDA